MGLKAALALGPESISSRLATSQGPLMAHPGSRPDVGSTGTCSVSEGSAIAQFLAGPLTISRELVYLKTASATQPTHDSHAVWILLQLSSEGAPSCVR
jgi:hypothetical protein